MKMAMDYGISQVFYRSCSGVVEVVHLVFIALDIGAADMCIDILHRLVVRPTDDLHADFLRDAEVRGEGSEAMPELMDCHTRHACSLAGALDGSAQGHLVGIKHLAAVLMLLADGFPQLIPITN